MIQCKLSKAQGFVVQQLATAQSQLQGQANEIQAALNEQAELARLKYKLPEGEARFTQGTDGWAIVVKPKPESAAEVPLPEVDEEGDIIAPIRAGKKPGPSETKAAGDA